MVNSAAAFLRSRIKTIDDMDTVKINGRITGRGPVMEGSPGLRSAVRHVYRERRRSDTVRSSASDDKILLMPLGEVRGIGPGSKIVAKKNSVAVSVGRKLLGRTLDALGNPIDGLGPIEVDTEYPLYSAPLNPLLRKRIEKPLDVGVKAINGLLTVGKGQRVGIFAGSGVGKSVLMGMMARNTEADVNDSAHRRGREVKEFIEKDPARV
jgi:flagellum-specific ATP synthase